MGAVKEKPFKVMRDSAGFTNRINQVPREAFQNVIEEVIGDCNPSLPDDVCEELRLWAASADRVAHGAWWLRKENESLDEACGCALASIATPLPQDLFAAMQLPDVTQHSRLIAYYDRKMANLTSTSQGIAEITD